jgi:thymidylate synthase
MRFDLSEGFPMLTHRSCTCSIIVELLWFLHTETSVKWLQGPGVSIWMSGPTRTANSAPSTTMAVWAPRRAAIDQSVGQERDHPGLNSRRLVVSAWNPADVDSMALPPATTVQFFVAKEN